MRVTKLCNLLIIFFVIANMIGCDAFVRKFTRKQKKEDIQKEEMVLAPEEYKPTMTKEELYRQYLLYWQSWQDELIEALGRRTNYKKQVSCAEQAIKNLQQLKPLLNAQMNKKLDIYIKQLIELKNDIVKDDYCLNVPNYRVASERLRRAILRDFVFHKVKDALI